jgi:hypothetical protein
MAGAAHRRQSGLHYMARKRNKLYTIPSYPTSSRDMTPDEQIFLSKAMKRIKDDVDDKSFHMHGESGVIGNSQGEIVFFDHCPWGGIDLPIRAAALSPPEPRSARHPQRRVDASRGPEASRGLPKGLGLKRALKGAGGSRSVRPLHAQANGMTDIRERNQKPSGGRHSQFRSPLWPGLFRASM